MVWVQIKVGQVWSHPDVSETYTITDIIAGYAHCISNTTKRKQAFIHVDKDGYTSLDPEWTSTMSLTAAKSSARSKECLCGIHRADCTYHKDQ